MKKRCVITGLGLICGTGNNVDTCWRNICAGKSGIDFVRSVSTEDCVSHVGAEVRCESLPNPEYDRSVRLCLHAAQEAIQDSGLMPEALRNARCDPGKLRGRRGQHRPFLHRSAGGP